MSVMKRSQPFSWVLPNHLHCIWTLPREDANFSTRWRLIKSWFSRQCTIKHPENISASRQSKREKAIWQRRFWEQLLYVRRLLLYY